MVLLLFRDWKTGVYYFIENRWCYPAFCFVGGGVCCGWNKYPQNIEIISVIPFQNIYF